MNKLSNGFLKQSRFHKDKRRWCGNCGRRIPPEKLAEAYASGKFLECSQCGVLTSAIAVDEVSGSLVDVWINDKPCLVAAGEVEG